MERIVKVYAEEAGKELVRNTNMNMSLEGWPCAITIIGLGIAYVVSVKIKCDAQVVLEEQKMNRAA